MSHEATCLEYFWMMHAKQQQEQNKPCTNCHGKNGIVTHFCGHSVCQDCRRSENTCAICMEIHSLGLYPFRKYEQKWTDNYIAWRKSNKILNKTQEVKQEKLGENMEDSIKRVFSCPEFH